MALSIITLIISIIIFLSVIIGLIVYTIYKLRKDLVLFKKIVPVSSGTPTNGTNGTDGISAYQKYMQDNPSPVLTEAQFNALFTGVDGIDGANAPAALDGSDADTGSTGVHGEMGIIGINGNKGAPGMKGLHGETFFNFYDVSSAPVAIENFCLIHNTNSTLNYFENFSTNIFSAYIQIFPPAVLSYIESPYISFILYNSDNTIKGITGPMIIPLTGDLQTVVLHVLSSKDFRYIVSPNKHSTQSSFTRHIIDKEYDNQQIPKVKNEEQDPFVVKLYNLISVNPNLQYKVDKLEKIFISEKQTHSTALIDLMPAVYF